MIQLDNNDLAMIWLALVIEQKAHEGTHTWFRFEHLIRRIEKELGMKERPRLKQVSNEN